MAYTVKLLDRETGEEEECQLKGPYSEFQWSEGNFGCDCNRALFMGHPAAPCGESRYEVISIQVGRLQALLGDPRDER